jgi:hypothetical protein
VAVQHIYKVLLRSEAVVQLVLQEQQILVAVQAAVALMAAQAL